MPVMHATFADYAAVCCLLMRHEDTCYHATRYRCHASAAMSALYADYAPPSARREAAQMRVVWCAPAACCALLRYAV